MSFILKRSVAQSIANADITVTQTVIWDLALILSLESGLHQCSGRYVVREVDANFVLA